MLSSATVLSSSAMWMSFCSSSACSCCRALFLSSSCFTKLSMVRLSCSERVLPSRTCCCRRAMRSRLCCMLCCILRMLMRICSDLSTCSPVFMSDTVFSACSMRRKPSCISLKVAMISFISLSFCSMTFCRESIRASVSLRSSPFLLLQELSARTLKVINKNE